MGNTLYEIRENVPGWPGRVLIGIIDGRPNTVLRDADGRAYSFACRKRAQQFIDHGGFREGMFIPYSPIPANSVKDLFSVETKGLIGENVVICGSAPSLTKAKFPAGYDFLALNSAVWSGNVYRWWLVWDQRFADHPKWGTPIHDDTKILFGTRMMNRIIIQQSKAVYVPHYQVHYMPSLARTTPPDEYLVHGIIRSGPSVLFLALGFCFWAGVKNILLAGCDMKGEKHYDGIINPDVEDDGAWPRIEIAATMVKELRRRGLTVSALTPTAIPGV